MRTLLILLLVFITTSLKAQNNRFDSYNSQMRIAKVLYELDGRGFWQRKENVSMEKVIGVSEYYAYNKKTQELFVKTPFANCIITVNDNLAKIYKKNSSIPKLKGDELDAAITKATRELDDEFAILNEKRQKAINDSIERARQDSIRKEVEDSIRAEQRRARATNYRNSHNWHWVPIKSGSLLCTLCNKSINTKDSIYSMAIRNDSVYWFDMETGIIDLSYLVVHAAKIPREMKTDPNYLYHHEVFGDSLLYAKPFYKTDAEAINIVNLGKYLDKVKNTAPNGVLLEWGWDDEFSVSFHFKYLNTNKKTIKYIALHWVIKNDVGDVRKTGYFKGTGPVEEWSSASWNWDHSSYYVAGDATIMNITKIVITYMDGTTVTIPKNKIVYG